MKDKFLGFFANRLVLKFTSKNLKTTLMCRVNNLCYLNLKTSLLNLKVNFIIFILKNSKHRQYKIIQKLAGSVKYRKTHFL